MVVTQRQELSEAVNAGSIERVQQLLHLIPESEQQDWLCQSALRAAYENRSEAVRALVRIGASPSCQDALGKTPLHWAAHAGHEAVVRILIENGAEVKLASQDGSTALHVSAEQNMGAVARSLLLHHADPVAVTKDKRTPLHVAADQGSAVVAAVLTNLFHKQVASPSEDAVPIEACEVEGAGGEADAPKAKSKSVVRELELENDRGETPLARAAARGHAPVAQLLLRCQADTEHPNWWGQHPLHLAAHGGHVACAAVLLEGQAAVDNPAHDASTALHTASERGFGQVVELLLSHGANACSVAVGGRQALHAAAEKGCADACEALVASMADVEARTDEERTPLSLGAARGHVTVVLRLLEKYADMDALDMLRQAPAHAAAANGRTDVVATLADKRARLDECDASGRTPLGLALSGRHRETAKLLLKRGMCMPRDWEDKPGMRELREEAEAELIREQLEAAQNGAFAPEVIRAAEKELEDARQKLLGFALSMATAEALPALAHAEAAVQDAVKLANDAEQAEQYALSQKYTIVKEVETIQVEVEKKLVLVRSFEEKVEYYKKSKLMRQQEFENLVADLAKAKMSLADALARNERLEKRRLKEEAKVAPLEAKAQVLRDEEADVRSQIAAIEVELAQWHAQKAQAQHLHAQAQALLGREAVVTSERVEEKAEEQTKESCPRV